MPHISEIVPIENNRPVRYPDGPPIEPPEMRAINANKEIIWAGVQAKRVAMGAAAVHGIESPESPAEAPAHDPEAINRTIDEWQQHNGVEVSAPYDKTDQRQRSETRRESVVGWNEEGVANAQAYLGQLFPEKEDIQLLSDEGSSGVVFEDGELVYKVFRTPDKYSYYEGETAAMQRLHELGMAPRPVALIDALPDSQREGKLEPNKKFGDIQIPRVQSEGELPVLVMEKVQGLSKITEAPIAVQKQLPNFLRTLHENDIALGDSELGYDTASGKLTIVDCGGTLDTRGYSAEQKSSAESTVLTNVTRKLGLIDDAKTRSAEELMGILDVYAKSLPETES